MPTHQKSNHGFALLEVLIAVIILAIGLLGVAALQTTTLRNGQSSLERSQAVALAYTILDDIRTSAVTARAGQTTFPAKATAANAIANGYNRDLVDAVPAAGGAFIPANQREWLLALQANLNASAQGGIACNAGLCTITIRWDDSRGTAGNAAYQISVSSLI